MIEGILLRNGHFGVDAGPENLRLFGGASRDRTDDLIIANDALSQLSYSPTNTGGAGFRTWRFRTSFPYLAMIAASGEFAKRGAGTGGEQLKLSSMGSAQSKS